MSKVITFSRTFPAYHPKAGQPTYFTEKIHQWLWDSFDLPYYSLHEMLQQLNPGVDVEGFIASLDTETIQAHKNTTIRAGQHFKPGDKFSPRVPYNSKQIIIAPDIEVVKTWNIEINCRGGGAFQEVLINDEVFSVLHNGYDEDYKPENWELLAKNDGLELKDCLDWFYIHINPKTPFTGQIICWNENVNY